MWRNWNPLVHFWVVCKQQNVLSVPQKVTHRVTIISSNSTSGETPKRNEETCPYKNLYMDMHYSIIHNSQKGETTHMSVKWWMDKPKWYIHTTKHYPAIKNKVLTHAETWMNLKTLYYVKEASHKGPHTVWFSYLYEKPRMEQANL